MTPKCPSAFLVLLASSCLLLSETGAVYQSIRVLKCCRNGETLVREGDEEIGHCVPTETPWQPLVYSPVVRDWVGIPKKWIIEEGAKPVCTDGVLTHVSGSSTSPFIFFDTGHVTLNGNIEEQYEPDKYCADEQGLLLCQPRSTMPKPKLRRCCGSDAHLYENNITCVSQKGASNLTVILGNATHVDITNDFPSCKSHLNYTIVGDMRNATILSDGGLEYEESFIPPEKFCLQSGLEDGIVKVVACSEYARHIPIVVAAADIRFTLYPIGFLISVVFLAATLAAGWLLPAAHHVLHWRCQTHHVACLMLGDLLMAIIQLASDSLNIWVCKGVAIAAHFFFLSAFFWLNTMCFNIWWTFRDLRPASLEKGQETVRLRVYACYAWGGPLLVAGLAALFDHLPPQPDYTFLKPRFGEAKCWFFGDMEILTYFFGPVGVLLAINLMLFAATARELTCGLWKREVVKSTTERAALGRVCMKLVVVMGVTWVADIVSWAAGGPHQVWYITDFINAVQGVFIFVVVGCQPQVWAALKRLCNRHPRSNVGRQGNAMSTTSHGMPSMGDSVTQNPSTKTAPLETIC